MQNSQIWRWAKAPMVGHCRSKRKLLWMEGLELENGPLTGFAFDLEDSTANIETIIPVWRRMFVRVNTEACRDGIRGGSRGQPCHEHNSALPFELVPISTKDAWERIGFVRALFQRAPASPGKYTIRI
jgi:hypothetical protein